MFNKVPELFFYYINIYEYIQGNKNPFLGSFTDSRYLAQIKGKFL